MPVYLEEEPSSAAQQTLDKVINLVVPTIVRERDRLRGEVIALRSQNAELRQQLNEIEGDFDALMELAANRRKPLTANPKEATITTHDQPCPTEHLQWETPSALQPIKKGSKWTPIAEQLRAHPGQLGVHRSPHRDRHRHRHPQRQGEVLPAGR